MQYIRDQLGTENVIVKSPPVENEKQFTDCMCYHIMDHHDFKLSLKSRIVESVNKSIDIFLVCTKKRKIDASIIMTYGLDAHIKNLLSKDLLQMPSILVSTNCLVTFGGRCHA